MRCQDLLILNCGSPAECERLGYCHLREVTGKPHPSQAAGWRMDDQAPEFYPDKIQPGIEWPAVFYLMFPDAWTDCADEGEISRVQAVTVTIPHERYEITEFRDEPRRCHCAYFKLRKVEYGLPVQRVESRPVRSVPWPEGPAKIFRCRPGKSEVVTLEAVSPEHAAEIYNARQALRAETRADDWSEVPAFDL